MNPVVLDKDIIVSIATPDGSSALGVVRLSGEGSWQIATNAIGSEGKSGFKARSAIVATVKDGGGTSLDQVVVLPWKSPNSYTGEDIVEFFCHGGRETLRLVLQRLVELGARQAEPGEFTRRAFINGKVDLEQAEAISALIEAKTGSAAKAALRVLEGGLGSKIRTIQDQLVHLLSLLELGFDFVEEEIDILPPDELLKSLEDVSAKLRDMYKQFQAGKVLRHGARVVIAGAPNAGKSTLLNRLIGYDRAIVSETPGTTRDYLDVTVDMDGIPVHLFDTAGLRATKDSIEGEGAARSQKLITDADLVVWLVSPPDLTLPSDKESLPKEKLIVLNKIDRIENPASVPFGYDLAVSALEGNNLDKLRRLISENLLRGYDPSEMVVLEERHAHCLSEALDRTVEARESLKQEQGPEVIALQIRTAINDLGEITGTVTTDEILNGIFAGFCIGK